LAGSRTAWLRVPLEQLGVNGAPAIVGVTVIWQLSALETAPVNVTVPPRRLRGADPAVNEEIVGWGFWATTTVVVAVVLPTMLVAVRVKV